MDVFEPFDSSSRPGPMGQAAAAGGRSVGRNRPPHPRARAGFTITEFLVAAAILLALFSVSAGAIAAARATHRKLTTRDVIAKLHEILIPSFVSFAGRNVPELSGQARANELIRQASLDLPEDWTVVEEKIVKNGPESGPQQVYAAIWKAIPDEDKDAVKAANGRAECLFMIVMQGGIADCLDCRSLLVDVGDTDRDGMPEFLDGWGRPIEFFFRPNGLRLPASSSQPFFSTRLPFDGSAATAAEARARVAKPLIVSAGPDGITGLNPDASPRAGAADNLTNFDEEAKQ